MKFSSFIRLKILSMPLWKKAIFGMVMDMLAIFLCLAFAFHLRLGFSDPRFSLLDTHPVNFMLVCVIYLLCFIQAGIYKESIRYMRVDFFWRVLRVVFMATLLWLIVVFFLRIDEFLPRTVPILFALLLAISMAGLRLMLRFWLLGLPLTQKRIKAASMSQTPVAIYGGGSAGLLLLDALDRSSQYRVVALVDKDAGLQGRRLAGRPVFSPTQIHKLIEMERVEEILLALPGVSRRARREIIQDLERFNLPMRSVPTLEDLAAGRATVQDLKEITVEDVLQRGEVGANSDLLGRSVRGKSVMVTGAGGSIGAELCRQIVQLKPKCLVLYEHSEFNLYSVDRSLGELIKETEIDSDVISVLGSVLDAKRVKETMLSYGVNVVYHAAAYKHVPLVEQNISQGIRNNVLGTLLTAEAAVLAGVERFVLISTDKAVRPTNVMGATKRLAEMLLQAISDVDELDIAKPESFGLRTGEARVRMRTCFTMVRFGNVLDSSGSVIPAFKQQINEGHVVTVTHPDIVRYFMTISEAAQLVIQAGAMAVGGEVFLLDMGEPVKILDLAKRMISLSGLTLRNEENPSGDIEIVFSGLRPGEKLFEEMLIDDNAKNTSHPLIFKGEEPGLPWDKILSGVNEIHNAAQNHEYSVAMKIIEQYVHGYKAADDVIDWLKQS